MIKSELPLVSVILPTYNRADFLYRSISSVLKQAYPHWELILWDDGSTDNTAEIVRSFGDERICYYHAENHGAAYARNRAIEHSTGGYIAFLDSDDEWLDGKLQAQVKAMQSHPEIEIIFTDFYNIMSYTGVKRRMLQEYKAILNKMQVQELEKGFFLIEQGFLEAHATEFFVATDTIMLRRELLHRIGLFNEELRNSEDFELWWRMGLAETRFAYLSDVTMNRHKPPGSLSSRGIPTCEYLFKALDLCRQETLTKNRADLLHYLDRLYRNNWQNLIPLHASAGDRKSMLNAFVQSLHYGFSLGSFRLLLENLLVSR